MLYDDLEGWDRRGVGGRLKREELYVYIQLIHTVKQQKLTQHFKAIILQLKKKKLPRNKSPVPDGFIGELYRIPILSKLFPKTAE